MTGGLGRRVPLTWTHVEKYPLRSLIADPQSELVVPPVSEKSLGLPWWWSQYDQGQEGSCVGFGSSAMMSVTNHYQRLQSGSDVTYRYDARWLYLEAQLVDDWPETPPAEGTSVNAGCKVLFDVGHRRIQRGVSGPALLEHGVSAYRWATTVDELRAAIYGGLAAAIGVNWYSDFSTPVLVNDERWIGRRDDLGAIRGGHCVCLYRYSDRREAFRLMNSWGSAYSPVWLPYSVMQRLMDEAGEAAVIVDR